MSDSKIRYYGARCFTCTADHVNFWRRHFATGLPILEQAFAACLEVGDLVYAGFLAFETTWQLIEKGNVLADVLSSSNRYLAFAQQSRNDAVYETIRLEQRFVASLQGKTKDPLTFDGGTFEEAACLAVIAKAAFGCGIVFYHIMKQVHMAFSGQSAILDRASPRSISTVFLRLSTPRSPAEWEWGYQSAGPSSMPTGSAVGGAE